MTVIVDANIVISAIINTKGIIPLLLFNATEKIDFVVPSFVFEELEKHKAKITEIANLTPSSFDTILNLIKQNLLIFSDEMIDEISLAKALTLTKDVDEKDTIYVAFSIALNALFWTGDNSLKRALIKKGFVTAISTKDLESIVKGL